MNQRFRQSIKKMILFRSLKPISRKFGGDRGTPIDRYYIEKFLENNKHLINGIVLEVGESKYTRKFGGDKVTKSMILHAVPKKNADIVGNLESDEGIGENLVDCFILTQTLLCIFDVQSAIRNAVKIVKPGGALLVTIPGITQISRFDYERWGQYWSFTDQTIQKLFESVVPKENIIITTYGNVKVAASFLYGLAVHEINRRDLDYHDDDYQMLISAVVTK